AEGGVQGIVIPATADVDGDGVGDSSADGTAEAVVEAGAARLLRGGHIHDLTGYGDLEHVERCRDGTERVPVAAAVARDRSHKADHVEGARNASVEAPILNRAGQNAVGHNR